MIFEGKPRRKASRFPVALQQHIPKPFPSSRNHGNQEPSPCGLSPIAVPEPLGARRPPVAVILSRRRPFFPFDIRQSRPHRAEFPF